MAMVNTPTTERFILIADSSALFALASRIDSTHQKAKRIAQQFSKTEGSIIVPSEIFFETINTIWKKITKTQALITGADILTSKTYSIIETTSELRALALDIFKRQTSKNVSFTDCLVMAFADQFKTKTIFGFDESFKKNGFLRLGIDS